MRTDEQRRTLISKLPYFTPKFEQIFYERDLSIQEMFLDIVEKLLKSTFKEYTTHKPDYSMSKNTVFCCIFLQVKCLMVHIKVNNHRVTSNSIQLLEYKDASKAKVPYIKFKVTDNNQIDEAFRLINTAYEFDI